MRFAVEKGVQLSIHVFPHKSYIFKKGVRWSMDVFPTK
jgi:hypothetical protein